MCLGSVGHTLCLVTRINLACPRSSGRPQTSATPPCGSQTIAPSHERVQCLGCVFWRLTVFVFMTTKVGIKQSGEQINQTVLLFETQRVVIAGVRSS